MPLDPRIALQTQVAPLSNPIPMIESIRSLQRQHTADKEASAERTRVKETKDVMGRHIGPDGKPDYSGMAAELRNVDPALAMQAWEKATAEDKIKIGEERERYRQIGQLAGQILEAPEQDRPRQYATARSLALARKWATPDQLPEAYDEGLIGSLHQGAMTMAESIDYIEAKAKAHAEEQKAIRENTKQMEDLAKEAAKQRVDEAELERRRKADSDQRAHWERQDRNDQAAAAKKGSEDDPEYKKDRQSYEDYVSSHNKQQATTPDLDPKTGQPKTDLEGKPLTAPYKPPMSFKDWRAEQNKGPEPASANPRADASRKSVLPESKGGNMASDKIVSRLKGRAYTVEDPKAAVKRIVVTAPDGRRVRVSRIEDDGTVHGVVIP